MKPDWETPAGRALVALAAAIQRKRLSLHHPIVFFGSAPLQIWCDLFYFQKDGRKSALWENTEKLWPRLYGRAIDVRAEIIQPVLDLLAGAGTDRDYLEEIRARLGL